MDPIGNLPFFITVIKGLPASEIKKNIERAIFVAGLLLFIFLFLGLKIFDFFGINLNSFQIAGGILLLIIGVRYVFGIPFKYQKSTSIDLSVPIGTPLLTGPGVITTTIILVKENGMFVVMLAAILTLICSRLIFMNYAKLYKLLGTHWISVISRVMGIILSAVAIEFITNGVINIVKSLVY
ncbi:MarC family protein [Candidatus Woesearchaeota archaeon]|nr:MarC family protein [Candidatus Woesearchaeota archaeon]